MTLKLPLPRYTTATGRSAVASADVELLERAYALLEERCKAAEAAMLHDLQHAPGCAAGGEDGE